MQTCTKLGTVCLAFSPIFFVMQGTFMSDVPALSFALIALALYRRALDGRSLLLSIGAAAIAVLAASTRQNMVALIPVMCWMLIANEARKRWLWWVVLGLAAATSIAVLWWFYGRSDTRHYGFGFHLERIIGLSLGTVEHCGLAVLPLLLLDWRPGLRGQNACKAFVIALAVFLGVAAYYAGRWQFLFYGGTFPAVRGVWSPYGPFNIKPIYEGQYPVILADSVRWLLTVLGCVGAAMTIERIIAEPKKLLHPVVIFAGLQFSALCMIDTVWDRYLLPLFPAALVLALPSPDYVTAPLPRLRIGLGMLAVTAAALVSIAFTHDWLAYNTARWQLGEIAMSRGIASNDIDGGWEWNCWTRTDLETPSDYALSFTERPGMTVVDRCAYSQWLPRAKRSVYLLKSFQPEN
jgi:4-amino-4-deoxy-L-arabinose transferase-like glycosyltransferase